MENRLLASPVTAGRSGRKYECRETSGLENEPVAEERTDFLGLRPISIRFGSKAVAAMLPPLCLLSSGNMAASLRFSEIGKLWSGRGVEASAKQRQRISFILRSEIDSHSGGMVA